jgi:hypothetical protein
MAKQMSETTTKARRTAAAINEVCKRLGINKIDARTLNIINIAFEHGFAAGGNAPAPFTFDPADPGAMLDTLEITKTDGRKTGGTWVTGTIAGHRFEALVFPEHAEVPEYELDGSRISKLWLKSAEGEVANFDRGWDRKPVNEMATAIVGLLAAGIAETVFGK